MKRKYLEDDLQMAVAKYLDLLGVTWFHDANERKTTFQAGVRLKKKGVKAGVPDVLIFEPNGVYNGLAIELKIKPNKVTVNQMDWLTSLQKKGWFTEICYTFEETKDIIDTYLINIK